MFHASGQNLCKIPAKRSFLLLKLMSWAMTKSGTVLKGTFWQLFFNLLKHRWVLKQKLYFRRTHFNGYFSSSNTELQTENELKILPYLLAYLFTYWALLHNQWSSYCSMYLQCSRYFDRLVLLCFDFNWILLVDASSLLLKSWY